MSVTCSFLKHQYSNNPPPPLLRMSSSAASLDLVNDFVHLPFVIDIVWYLYWMVMLAVSPALELPLLLAFVYRVALRLFNFVSTVKATRKMVVVITGCDTGRSVNINGVNCLIHRG